MSLLWSSDDPADWHRALDAYPAAVAAHGQARLPELDRFHRVELPALLAARTPPRLALDELVRVTEWKMKRGKWRARNLALVRSNPPDAVERASREAFAAAPDPRRPVALLAELAGVGPATASAALAALRPDVYPFFDEEVAELVPGLGPVAFSLPYYLRYAAELRARAARLAPPFTAHAVAQALWSSRHIVP